MTKQLIPFNGPFPISSAILYSSKHVLEVSGQIGVDTNGTLLEGIEAQTKQTLLNVQAILQKVDWDLSHVIKTRVYLTDMKDYAKMNEVYAQYFTKDFPTRTTLAVKELPRGALVEIECTACNE